MRELDPGFTADRGPFDGNTWSALMAVFRDASLYQTWAYDRTRRHQPIMQMALRRGNAVVAAVQLRILRLPIIPAGIAYARWGPMWRRRGVPDDPEVFRQAIRALRREFSLRRGLLLRLYPLARREGDDALANVLAEEGYRCAETSPPDRTLVLDLRLSLDELRASLDQKWRNCLNKAEKSGLDLLLGEESRLFDAVADMHAQMLARKGPVDTNDLPRLKRVQSELPSDQKLKVVLCLRDGVPCAGAVFSALGDTGVYIRGATSDAGRTTNGSYLVQWAFVRWLKEHAFSYYDLNGINPQTNPGTYTFKRGLAGRRGRDTQFLGRFEVADRSLSQWLITQSERMGARYGRLIAGGRRLATAAARYGRV
jgi:hypothetical protein